MDVVCAKFQCEIADIAKLLDHCFCNNTGSCHFFEEGAQTLFLTLERGNERKP